MAKRRDTTQAKPLPQTFCPSRTINKKHRSLLRHSPAARFYLHDLLAVLSIHVEACSCLQRYRPHPMSALTPLPHQPTFGGGSMDLGAFRSPNAWTVFTISRARVAVTLHSTITPTPRHHNTPTATESDAEAVWGGHAHVCGVWMRRQVGLLVGLRKENCAWADGRAFTPPSVNETKKARMKLSTTVPPCLQEMVQCSLSLSLSLSLPLSLCLLFPMCLLSHLFVPLYAALRVLGSHLRGEPSAKMTPIKLAPAEATANASSTLVTPHTFTSRCSDTCSP